MKLKNPKKYFSFFLVSVLFLTNSCKKNSSPGHSSGPCSTTSTTLISDPDFVRCKYKVNSTWIFKDSISNSFDTLTVSSTTPFYGFLTFQPEGCDTLEHLYIFLKSSDRSYLERYDVNQFDLLPDRLLFYEANEHKVITINSKGTLNGTPFQFYDSLYIQDRYYKKVFRSDTIHNKAASFANASLPTKMILYFNMDNGFLRTDLFNLNNQLISRKKAISRNIIL